MCLTNPCLLFRFLPFLAHISQTTQARPPLNCIFRVSRRISRRFVYVIPYFRFHQYLSEIDLLYPVLFFVFFKKSTLLTPLFFFDFFRFLPISRILLYFFLLN